MPAAANADKPSASRLDSGWPSQLSEAERESGAMEALGVSNSDLLGLGGSPKRRP